MAREAERRPNSFEQLAESDREALRKAELYRTHKAHGSLSIFHQLYPDNPPRVDERTGEVIRER